MIKPSYMLSPSHNSYADILRKFKDGKPLSPEQLNFLRWHTHQISSPELDPIMKYYGAYPGDKRRLALFGDPSLNSENIEKLKERLHWLLEGEKQHIIVEFSANHLLALRRHIILHELNFWHGNRLFTGGYYYHGAIPHHDYFRWGNLFGAVIYEKSDEDEFEGNVLVYFEDLHTSTMEESIRHFNLNRIHYQLESPYNLRTILMLQPIDQHHTPVEKAPEPKLAVPSLQHILNFSHHPQFRPH